MKKRVGFVAAAMLFCFICFVVKAEAAQSITFAWTPNTETDLAGYRLYRSDVPGQYIFGKGKEIQEVPKGTEKATVTGAQPGYFVLTAFDNDGFESGPSAELNTFPPVKPKGFKITILVETIE